MDGRGSSISMADSNGALLFYANTRSGFGNASTLVYDRQHQIMQNGNLIRGEAWYKELVTIPIGSDKYFLFSMNEVFTATQGFYYSIIDIIQNGGLGAVIQKNVQLNNFRNADCVTAIKHGNGRDWWILSKYSTGNTTFNRFYLYLVVNDSIYSPIIQDINNSTDGDNQKIIFNSSGNKLMQINTIGFMCEYDFNRCTGVINNPNIIFTEQSSNYNRLFWDGAYSQNGNIFYVSTSFWTNVNDGCLLQYDMTSANIPASCDTLDTWQVPIGQAGVRLAPDGKIYISRPYLWAFPGYPYPDSVHNYVNENLSVINQPDNLGSSCDYQPFSFNLGGKRTYYGLPNNPDYSLGPVSGSGCDSLFNNTHEVQISFPKLIVSPNPATKIIYVNAKGLNEKKATIRIINSIGEEIYTEKENVFLGGYLTKEIAIENFTPGIYFLRLSDASGNYSLKFIKE